MPDTDPPPMSKADRKAHLIEAINALRAELAELLKDDQCDNSNQPQGM